MGFLGIGESDFKPERPGAHNNPYWETGQQDKEKVDHALFGLDSGQAQQASYAQAPQAAPVQLGWAPPAQQAHLGYVPPAATGQLNYGAMAPGLGVTAGGLANDAGTRELQRMNLGLLGQAAVGSVPSAAEAQLQRGLDAGLKQNLAMAASASGTAANQTAARTNAMRANTSAQLQTGGQAAQLRAAEQATARQALTDSLTGIRNQDLGVAGLGSQLAQTGLQAASTQLGAETQTNLGNLQAGTTLATAQLGSDTQTNLGNLGAQVQQGIAQMSSSQAVELANLDAKLTARGMDERARLDYLGKIIGIDTSTAEGQVKMWELYNQAMMQQQQIAAGISLGNAAGETAQLGSLLSGGSAVGASVVTGGNK